MTTININGINELDLTLPGTTTASTSSGVTSISNTITFANIGGTLLPGQLVFPYVAITSAYAITTNDFQVECTSGTFSVTLPDATLFKGRVFSVKNSGTGTITLATTSFQTIDGSLTQPLSQWFNLTVMSNGTNWIII